MISFARLKKKNPFGKQIFSPPSVGRGSLKFEPPNFSSFTQWKFLSRSHNASVEAAFHACGDSETSLLPACGFTIPQNLKFSLDVSVSSWQVGQGKECGRSSVGFLWARPNKAYITSTIFHWPEVTAKLNPRKAETRGLATCQRKGKLSQWKTHQCLPDVPNVSGVAFLREENTSAY